MDVTTIKVPKALRDRIASSARTSGVSAAELITGLLDDRDRQARLAAVRASYAERDVEYDAETAAWDRLAGDGVE